MSKLFFLWIVYLVIFYNNICLADSQTENLKFQATGLNNHFTFPTSGSFAEYVATTQAMVKQARTQAHVNNSDKVILENSPLALYPTAPSCKKNANGKYQNGILLIHGMLDSPYAMQQLGKYFQTKCFVTYVILLPGHGTVPGDLLHVKYQDWVAATDFGVLKLAEQANNLYLGGHSLGGLLAIHQALQHPTQFKGLILFAPALEIKSKLVFLTKPIYYLSRIIEPLQWWERYSESSDVRYESLPVNPIYQIHLLMGIVSTELKDIPLKLPLFIEQSAEDVTIEANRVLDLMKIDDNIASRMQWFSEKNAVPMRDTRVLTIMSYLPQEKILDLSHISLILPASDPIYGINGSYKSCLQYSENSSLWLQCKVGKDTYLGEITDFNLRHYVVQRITFNPFYERMITGLDAFFSSPSRKGQL